MPSQEMKPYNLVKLPNFALELVRAGISARTGAALANALFMDLKDFFLEHVRQFLPAIVVDRYKVMRAMDKVRKESNISRDKNHGRIVCVGIDGRNDTTNVLEERNGRLHSGKSVEHHLSFTNETTSGSAYITHATVGEQKKGDYIERFCYYY